MAQPKLTYQVTFIVTDRRDDDALNHPFTLKELKAFLKGELPALLDIDGERLVKVSALTVEVVDG